MLKYKDSGSFSISTSITDFLSYDSAKCPYNDCIIEYVSGINNLAKFTFTNLGVASFSTASPITVGSGNYRWKCAINFLPAYSKTITIQIADNCGSPNVLTEKNPPDISKV